MGEGIKRLLGSNSCIPSQLLEGFWVLVSFVPFVVHGFCFKDLSEAGLSLGSIKDLPRYLLTFQEESCCVLLQAGFKMHVRCKHPWSPPGKTCQFERGGLVTKS